MESRRSSEQKEKEWVDPRFWEELSGMDPREVCRKALVQHRAGEGYTVLFLDREILCHPEGRRVWQKGSRPDESVHPLLRLLMVHYLLHAQEVPRAHRIVTEKDLPGGALFFQGPHALPADIVEKTFSGRVGRLFGAGKALGARALEFGDCSFELRVLPRVPMGILFWDGDGEFPSRCVFTFDATVERHLPLDVIWAMAILVVDRILQVSGFSG